MVKKVIDIFPPRKPFVQNAETPGKLSADYSALPKETVSARPKITFVNRPKVDDNFYKPDRRTPLLMIVGKIAVGAAVVAAAMMVANWKYARAVVTIWPETANFSETAKVVVDNSIKIADFDKKIIPGITVSVEKTIANENPVTGKKTTQGKARGTVKIFNNFTKAQRLVKNSRLQAPLEKFQPALAKDETPWFKTDEEVVVEPKSSATVGVTAGIAGDKYNIAPSVFSVPGLVGTAQYTFIYAQSFEKFQGGMVGDASLATQDDLDRAKSAISIAGKEAIEKELEKATPAGYVLIKDTAKYNFEDPVISAASGAQVEKLGGQIKAKATAIAYKKEDLDSLGVKFILSKVSEKDSVQEDSLDIRSSYAGTDSATGRPSLDLNARVLVYASINSIDLKKGLLEKSREESAIFLNNMAGLKESKIFIDPPWQFSIPRDLERVEVSVVIE